MMPLHRIPPVQGPLRMSMIRRRPTDPRVLAVLRLAAIAVCLLLCGCSLLPEPARTGAQTPTRVPRAATTTPPQRTISTPAPQPTRTSARPIDGFDTIAPDQLPAQARQTLALIAQGGPFPYRQDGAVFQNRERLLPRQPNGYYHEYTVETPESDDRGARRIITGAAGEIFYTSDHYASFVQVLSQ